MTDLVFLAILVVFFAVAVLFVRACDRIIGTDAENLAPATDEQEPATADRPAA